ncbi:MerR family transcriptional regulator [Acetobacter indonesiensis]|uniref:MerR family transcriptional regulator n=1 Tax=Acetobacter indonesiensis TaxID=104101 RepID=UPI001F012447|nr:MerR family transcriptional regulator [Acetobacter indonesiensis]MCG0994286.1 MerR family transcriptional regulator [Acetobacter indonesiensis]
MTEETSPSMEDQILNTIEEEETSRSEKGPLAFRTISEVADELHVPQHVLRFWETRFEQVRPLKRGGGRRYYRPSDIDLLRYIADLLYTKGYTVKGVQRLLREGGYAASEATSKTVPSVEPDGNETSSLPVAQSNDVLTSSDAAAAEGEQIRADEESEQASVESGDQGDSHEITALGTEEGLEGTEVQSTEVIEVVAEEPIAPSSVVDAALPTTDDVASEVSVAAASEPSGQDEENVDASVTEEDVIAAFASAPIEEERTETVQAHDVADPERSAVVGQADNAATQNIVWLEKQNTRLRNDLSDILLELEALRSRLSA